MGSLPLSLSSSAAGTPFLLLYLSIFSFIFFVRETGVCVCVCEMGVSPFSSSSRSISPWRDDRRESCPLRKAKDIFWWSFFLPTPPPSFFRKSGENGAKTPERTTVDGGNKHPKLIGFCLRLRRRLGGWRWGVGVEMDAVFSLKTALATPEIRPFFWRRRIGNRSYFPC